MLHFRPRLTFPLFNHPFLTHTLVAQHRSLRVSSARCVSLVRTGAMQTSAANDPNLVYTKLFEFDPPSQLVYPREWDEKPVKFESLLRDFRPFQEWKTRLAASLQRQKCSDHPFHTEPYKVHSVTIQAFDLFGPRIGFMKIVADVSNNKGDWLPGAIFLRGSSVAMMVILQPDDLPLASPLEKYVIMTLQPRMAAASLSFLELPAGMLDDGTFAGAAAKEIEEECGLIVDAADLFNMSELALASQTDPPSGGEEEVQQNAVFPSPGACDEMIPIFLCEKRVPRKQLGEWQDKLTGLREEGERISLKLVPLDQLWKMGARDAKALAAIALYQGLKEEGYI